MRRFCRMLYGRCQGRRIVSPRIVVLSLSLLCTVVHAFDVDGFRSGMSREELNAVASFRSFETWNTGPSSVSMGKPAESRIDGSFAFCNRQLSSYSRAVDVDADYYQVVHELLLKYGQPTKVLAKEEPWIGTGGGSIRSIEMFWRHGKERTDVRLSPEGSDGTGALRYKRYASISFVARTTCNSKYFDRP